MESMAQSDPSSDPSPDYVVLNQEVQRLLGRCLLRTQQAERVLKAILTAHQVAGSGKDTASLMKRRAADVAKLGLGDVVDLFFEDVVRVSLGSEEPETKPAKKKPIGRPGKATWLPRRQAKAEAAALAAGKPWFATTLIIQTQREAAQTQQRDLKALVALRNRVVHHFSDEYDTRTLQGCECALMFLTEADETLCKYLETIQTLALNLEEARVACARAISGPGVLEAILDAVSIARGEDDSHSV
ncbi:MAG: hypothetical protein ACOZJX_07080 [Pseudomonadota bacterium]